ncbi:hypothetical protein E2C01_088453 [Portunus trituberculatus]|uniref:Uncharacterized protein n=1 Tax=Portunus trituberculatus TaxID=210409 RepID=A0A5B7JEI7_PORTR|nr:hypothetical protein [Portunus trituberculatus]
MSPQSLVPARVCLACRDEGVPRMAQVSRGQERSEGTLTFVIFTWE